MGASRQHDVAAWPPETDPREILELWHRLGVALLAASLAYGGRAERIREEEPALPRLAVAARAVGVGLAEARDAVLWLLGEGEGELQHLVVLLAALLTGLPRLFRLGLTLPLVRQAARLLGENQGGGSLSHDDGVRGPLAHLVLGRVKEALEVRFAPLPHEERRNVVRAEQNRLRKDLAPDLARVDLEQPEALGPNLAARLCPTLLDRLQRHPQKERFVEALREAAAAGGGAGGDGARRRLREQAYFGPMASVAAVRPRLGLGLPDRAARGGGAGSEPAGPGLPGVLGSEDPPHVLLRHVQAPAALPRRGTHARAAGGGGLGQGACDGVRTQTTGATRRALSLAARAGRMRRATGGRQRRGTR